RLGAAPADCVVLEDAAPGAAAAHAAGMRCIAIPYVAAQADAPEFATAALLLRGGQEEFTARAAYEWMAASS
ncbi:MAG: HAD family phosphatase, partial [Streptomyces sp.]|nr:HAD family phosphatase [Streptomyces sp.]NUS17848.1 HAD family phosphatase [Streptomyces sp.]NUS29226.1 HAD family phosphatase [Streptomyces sp.]NUS76129.1 HAD family phosphatase [Streptomyces sp.]